MSNWVGRMFRGALAGLLVLSLLFISGYLAEAVGWNVLPKSEHHATSSLVGDNDQARPPAGHDHSGTPCKDGGGTDGLPCCFSGGCQMVSAWLSVASPMVIPARSATPIYWTSSTQCPENMAHAPALGPPRNVV
jgi:hypothetical protein